MQSVYFSMQSVGANGTSLSNNGGVTLSGIAGVAENVTGNVLSEMTANVPGGGASFATIFRADKMSVLTQAHAQVVFAGVDSLIAVVNKKTR